MYAAASAREQVGASVRAARAQAAGAMPSCGAAVTASTHDSPTALGRARSPVTRSPQVRASAPSSPAGAWRAAAPFVFLAALCGAGLVAPALAGDATVRVPRVPAAQASRGVRAARPMAAARVFLLGLCFGALLGACMHAAGVGWRQTPRTAPSGYAAIEGEDEAHAAFDGSAFEFILDSGANIHVCVQPELFAGLTIDKKLASNVSGVHKGNKMSTEGKATVAAQILCESGAGEPYTMLVAYAPNGSRNLLSESKLIKATGCTVVKGPLGSYVRYPSGESTKLRMRNGLYFIDVARAGAAFARRRSVAGDEALSAAEDQTLLLWAARMHICDPQELRSFAKGADGVSFGGVGAGVHALLKHDFATGMANAKRHPVKRSVEKPATLAGERLVLDGYGPVATPSVVDGSTYLLCAVDEKTDYSFVQPVRFHGSSAWLVFVRRVILRARSYGHTVKYLRVDRASYFMSDAWVTQVETEFHVVVEPAPRNHHEGVGRAEVFNDTRTRKGEAMVRRANRGAAYALPSQVYGAWLHNHKTRHGGRVSRAEEFTGACHDFAAMPPYLFDTAVYVIEEESVRGPKGALAPGRATLGNVLGISGSAYVVRKKGGGIVMQRRVRPVDEDMLLQRCLAQPRGAVAEASTQTDATPPAPPPRAARPSPPPKPVRPAADPLALVGERIEVLWARLKGYFIGTVVAYDVDPKGKVIHNVVYDNPGNRWKAKDQDKWHSLDTAGGDATVTWRFASTPHPAGAPAPQGPRLRSAARTAPQGTHADTPDVVAAHALLHDASNIDEADAVCEAVEFQFYGTVDEAHKASQSEVPIETDIGRRIMSVPSSVKQLLASSEREQWLEADRVAFEVIKGADPRNRLVRRADVVAAGAPISKVVTTRKLKVDQATQKLAAKNPFKSRHAVDENRSTRPIEHSIPSYAPAASDSLVKMVLAKAATADRNISKADVGNAYAKAERLDSPVAYMELPATQQQVDDEGFPQCLEYYTPIWGEAPAGREWWLSLRKTLLGMGWCECMEVPCLWTFQGDADTNRAEAVTIVDDILLSEADGTSVTERTLAVLREKYGEVAFEREPTSFAGMKVERDRGNRAITLSMCQKIEELFHLHAPLNNSGTELPAAADRLKSIAAIADSLRLRWKVDGDTPRKKLSKDQKRVQEIIGALKFPERVMPALTLVLHRLSSIMSDPPPEANAVCDAALIYAWEHRHDGLTYGGLDVSSSPRVTHTHYAVFDMGDGAPTQLEGHADATWGGLDIIGELATFCGAAVHHRARKIHGVTSSSQESEAAATRAISDTIIALRDIAIALKIDMSEPTFIGSDAKGNVLIATEAGTPKQCKHFFRRYTILRQRERDGIHMVRHVSDAENPSDFLTKWIGRAKFVKSIAYATNSRNRVLV
jgi:hypothetical protein